MEKNGTQSSYLMGIPGGKNEMEIVHLSVAGLSNRQIVAELGLSERTVEHHHQHIYNKLRVENKIELYNRTLKYRSS